MPRDKARVTRRVITLLTDFGTGDTYVGEMKGAILRRAEDVELVDLTHAIAPGDVAHGGYLLERAFRAFPEGTIHVAVVDPGVGTGRKALLVAAHGHLFIGPDNGLLARAISGDDGARAWRLDPGGIGPTSPWATFHGRDLFAPTAALCLSGLPPAGDRIPLEDLVGVPAVRDDPRDGATVTVIHVDRFGNAVLDVRADRLELPREAWSIHVGTMSVGRWERTYGDAAPEGPILLVGSSGDVEIAIRDDSATRRLGLSRGDRVTLHRRPPQPPVPETT